MYLRRFVGFFHIFLLFVNCSQSLLDYNDLMRSYYLLCGPDYFCLPSNVTHGWEISPNLSYRHMHVCPDCQCDDDCIKRGDCCADLFFSFPDLSCVNRTIIQGRYNENKTEHSSALMVTTCPAETNDEIKDKCVSLNDTKSRLRNFPVTGLQTPITFYNKYCAECHGVANYSFWTLDIDCFHFTDFNFLSTLGEVIDAAFDGECIFQAFREDDASGELKQENCFDVDEGETLFTKCNQTGEWLHYDSNIDYACESVYKGKYRLFKNIFCYMCNPGQDLAKEAISECNITGQWESYDNGLERACAELPFTALTVPFKNIFCYLCNRRNDSFQMFVDIVGQIKELSINDTYYRFQYDLDIADFNSKFFVYNSQKKIEKDNSLSTVMHTPFDKNSFRTNDGTVINITNLLLQNAALSGLDVCKSRHFLYPVGHSSSCKCDITCFFNFNKDECCEDLSLQIPMRCRDTLLHHPFQVYKSKGLPTVNGCFQEKTSKITQMGCSVPDFGDIYSQIPLTKSNGVHYDNFYCVLCNFGSDELMRKMQSPSSQRSVLEIFTSLFMYRDISPENDNFIYIDQYMKSKDEFNIWDLEMVCPRYLDYSHYLKAGDILRLGKETQCRIRFKKETKGMQTCLLPIPKNIKRCADGTDWTYADSDAEWACNNLTNLKRYAGLVLTDFKSRNDHYRGYIYTNLYCALCKPLGRSLDNFIDSCPAGSDSQLCSYYPRIYYYYPYKNLYCTLCNTYNLGIVQDVDYGSELDIYDRVVGINWFPILRNLFSFSGDEVKDNDTEDGRCKSNQVFDQIKDLCRNITCFSGKNLDGRKCKPLFEKTMNLRYSMMITIAFNRNMEQSANTSYTTTLKILESSIKIYFDSKLDVQLDFEILTIAEAESDKEITHEHCKLVELNILIRSSVPRVLVEQTLIELKHTYDKNCDMATKGHNEEGNNEMGRKGRIRRRSTTEHVYPYIFSAKVSNVLMCPQIELDDDEYTVSDDALVLTLHRDGFRKIAYDEFGTTPDGRMRVCFDYLQDINYFLIDRTLIEDLQQKYLWIMSLASSVISAVSLVLSVSVYLILPSLRTIPGKIIMLLMTSLLFTSVFHQVSYFAVQVRYGCIIVGIGLHFLWLSVFLCTKMAIFHMWRIFTSKEVGPTSEYVFQKYLTYILVLSTCMVCLNIALGFFIHADPFWGYGGSKCFVKDFHLLIALFICPVAVICLLNIVFFSLTVHAIKKTPVASSNQKKRNELVIFVRMATVTGVSWLLQIIDSFLPFTYFTFFATIVNSLQGFFIFIAFIVNKRVMDLLRKRFTNTEDHQSAPTKQTTD